MSPAVARRRRGRAGRPGEDRERLPRAVLRGEEEQHSAYNKAQSNISKADKALQKALKQVKAAS